MKIRINLLPHRELKRKVQQQRFITLAVLTALLGLMMVWGVNELVLDQIDYQEGRNQYLQNEISRLDKKITEIKSIKEKIQELLARKNVVESLQGDRAKAVHMLDQVARQMPEGVYLKSLKQKDNHVQLAGYAQSNAWVSTLMRNLDASPWLESPLLIEIKATTVNGVRLSEFDLDIRLSDFSETNAAVSEEKAALNTMAKVD